MKFSKLISMRAVLAIVGTGLGYALAQVGVDENRETQEVAINPQIDQGAKKPAADHWAWQDGNGLNRLAAEDARMALADDVDFEDIPELVRGLNYPFQLGLAQQLLVRLAEHDGAAAFELLDKLNLPERVEWRPDYSWSSISGVAYMRSAIVRKWASYDPVAALAHLDEWGKAKPEWSPDVRLSTIDLIRSISTTDPDKAYQLAKERGLWEVTSGRLQGRSLEEDLQRFEQLDAEGRLVPREFNTMLNRYAEQDPDAVYEALLEMPQSAKLEQGVVWVAGRFSGERLMNLRRHFAENVDRDWSDEPVVLGSREESDGTLQAWAMRSPQEAIAWTADLPEDEREHHRAVALVGAALNDPEWALGEMESLPPEKRHQAMVALAPEWFNRDRAAASRWIDSVEDVELQNDLRLTIEVELGERLDE